MFRARAPAQCIVLPSRACRAPNHAHARPQPSRGAHSGGRRVALAAMSYIFFPLGQGQVSRPQVSRGGHRNARPRASARQTVRRTAVLACCPDSSDRIVDRNVVNFMNPRARYRRRSFRGARLQFQPATSLALSRRRRRPAAAQPIEWSTAEMRVPESSGPRARRPARSGAPSWDTTLDPSEDRELRARAAPISSHKTYQHLLNAQACPTPFVMRPRAARTGPKHGTHRLSLPLRSPRSPCPASSFGYSITPLWSCRRLLRLPWRRPYDRWSPGALPRLSWPSPAPAGRRRASTPCTAGSARCPTNSISD